MKGSFFAPRQGKSQLDSLACVDHAWSVSPGAVVGVLMCMDAVMLPAMQSSSWANGSYAVCKSSTGKLFNAS